MATEPGSSTHTNPLVDTRSEQEQRLLRRLAAGDREAFWELWEHYRTTTLARHCLRWMDGNRQDAEDALSSACLRALSYLPDRAHDITNVRAWLLRLLHNHCMNMRKTISRGLPSRQTAVRAMERATESAQAGAETLLLHAERDLAVRRAVQHLPAHLRAPVILHYFQDVSHHDIAQQLGLSPDNVRKRLQLARAMLKQQLTSDGETQGAPRSWQLAAPSPPDFEAQACDMWHARQTQDTVTAQVVAIRPVCVILPDSTEHHVYVALDHKPVRQWQKVRTLRAYIARHPGGWRKRAELARVLYTLGHWDEAIDLYRQVAHRRLCGLDVWLHLGRMLHLRRQEDEAIAVYKDAMTTTHHRAAQQYLQGCVALCRQRLDDATHSFHDAAISEPENPAHWQALAQTYLQADRPLEALEVFTRILSSHPHDLIALTYSYVPLLMVGRWQEAQRCLERAVRLDAANVLALAQLVEHRCRMGWVEDSPGKETRLLLARALRQSRLSPDVQAAQARFYIVRGEWERGLAGLRQYVAQHPSCAAAWYHYARWCYRTGRVQPAAEAILRACRLDSCQMDIAVAACTILSAAERFDVLRPLLAPMLQRFPSSWRIWGAVSHALPLVESDSGHACAVSAQSPALQPQLARAWFNHAQVLALAATPREAIVAFERAWKLLILPALNPLSAPIALHLGELHQVLGDHDASHAWLRVAARHARALAGYMPAPGHYWHGRALAALGLAAEARQAYCVALQHHLLYPARLEAEAAAYE